MKALARKQDRVDKGMIVIASVLLLGVVSLAVGYFSGNRLAFYAGVFVTLAGVLTGVQRLTGRGES